MDILIIPGGIGTRAPSPRLDETIKFVRDVYPKLGYLMTVCTGSGIAARAGVLDGKRATTNKLSWAQTIAHGPKVKWVAEARWIKDGNICKPKLPLLSSKAQSVNFGRDRGSLTRRLLTRDREFFWCLGRYRCCCCFRGGDLFRGCCCESYEYAGV